MYYSMRRNYYWPILTMDCHNTVRNCETCAKNRVKLRKRQKFLRLFPATEPLEFISIDILGPLITSTKGMKFLLVFVDRFTKLVSNVPLTHWVMAYGLPNRVLSDNGKQFTSRLFQHESRLLGAKKFFTTAYHPQSKRQVEV